MQKLLLIFFLFFSQALFAQRGLLFVKKKGYKKVATFAEGATIKFKTKDAFIVHGIIAFVKSDSLFINGYWYKTSAISKIILREKDGGMGTMLLLTTAGVAISTAGMTLAKWRDFPQALSNSAALGYGNFIIRSLPKFIKRKKYNIGKKFTLQTLDLHF